MIRSSTISTLNVGTTGGLCQCYRHHAELDRFFADCDERELPKSVFLVAAEVSHSWVLEHVNDLFLVHEEGFAEMGLFHFSLIFVDVSLVVLLDLLVNGSHARAATSISEATAAEEAVSASAMVDALSPLACVH